MQQQSYTYRHTRFDHVTDSLSSTSGSDSSLSAYSPPANRFRIRTPSPRRRKRWNYYINHKHKTKSKATHPHLISWLHIQTLLKEFNGHQTISNDALSAIIDTLHFSRNQFISSLFKYKDLRREQLHCIYNILKQDMCIMLHNNPDGHNPLSSSSKRQQSLTSFNQLSIPSIENICAYLSKRDMLSFKSTSINIAIIALQEMKKYHICMFNMNELSHSHYNHFSVLKSTETINAMKEVRCTKSMTMKKVVEMWSKHYNIEPNNIALIHKRFTGLQFDLNIQFSEDPRLSKHFLQCLLNVDESVIMNYMDLAEFKVYDLCMDQFFVLDKSKMCIIYDIQSNYKEESKTEDVPSNGVVYDASKEWSCSECTFVNQLVERKCAMCDSFKLQVVKEDNDRMYNRKILKQKYGQQCVILLNYFDLKQQKISFCRSLVVHKQCTSDELKGYIEKHVQIWVAQYDSELFQLINQMKAYNKAQNIKDSIIDLHQYTDKRDFRHCDNHKKAEDGSNDRKCVEIYVFQLNPSHHLMSIRDGNYICRLRMYYDRILDESFCSNPNALMQNIYKQLKWKNNGMIPEFGSGYFTLSPLLTTHVCSYLDENDIQSFKMVSSGAAMACLKEMRKIKIASLYMSSICNNDLLTLQRFRVQTHINYTRVHKELQIDEVCHLWSQQYNIPHDELLILLCDDKPTKYARMYIDKGAIYGTKILHLLYNTDAYILTNKYLKSKQINTTHICLIFDKRQLFQVNPCIHTCIEDDHIHKILLLTYFNIVTANLSDFNPLMLTLRKPCAMNDIESFIIENAYEMMPDALCQIVHKMKEINDKQNIFKFNTTSFDKQNEIQCNKSGRDTNNILNITNNSGSRLISNMIFQINDEHDLFRMKNKLNTQHIPRSSPRALFQHEFIAFRCVSNGLTVAQCLRYFNTVNLAMETFQEVMIKVRPMDRATTICKLISGQFANKIPFGQIQLFVNLNENTRKPIKSNESLSDVGIFIWNEEDEKYRMKPSKENCYGLNSTILSWTIAPLCWLNRHPSNKMVMYNISVYLPSNIHLEQGYETLLPHTIHNFYVPFKRKFIVKELIDYLQSMCRGMYTERSNSLLTYFGATGDVLTDKYSFVISASSGTTAELMENCYEYDAMIKYKVNMGRKICVFIVDNAKYRDWGLDEQLPVIIRFKKKERRIVNDTCTNIESYYKHIGRPSRMWVNRSDLLSNIKRSQGTPPSLVMYNGFLSLINVEVYCFYNQVSPPISTKRLLKNDSMLSKAIYDKQKKNHTSKIYHVLLVTVS